MPTPLTITTLASLCVAVACVLVAWRWRRRLMSMEAQVAEQRRAMRRAMAADRIAALGRLAAGIGHEINNPLTFAMVNLAHCRERLVAGAELDDDGRQELLEAISDTQEGARRIADIVADFRCFARNEHDHTTFDMHDAIEVALRLTDNELRGSCAVRRRFGQLPPVEASEGQVVQVMVNVLLSLAWQLDAASGGTPSLTIATAAIGDAVAITVSVDRVRLVAGQLSSFCDPFDVSNPYDCLGLGVSQTMVEEIGGGLEARVDEDGGATIDVRLPASEDTAPASRDLGASGGSASLVGARILVADVDPEVAEAVRRCLFDASVDVVTDETDVLAAFARDHYDALLCDVAPGASVYHALKARGRGEERQVVFMSEAADSRLSLDRCPDDYAGAFVDKPVRRSTIRAALAERVRSRAI